MRETAAQRLSRLLALVPWLDSHPGVSMTEAAQHFGVSPAALEEDLWLLVCSGLPGHGPDQLIDIQFWDDDGIIDVIDPQTLQRPLRLTAEEATALLVGLRLLGSVPGAADHATIASVTARLEESLGAASSTLDTAHLLDHVDPTMRATLAAALSEEREVHLRYAGATSDSETVRVVVPITLTTYAGQDYLIAFCRSAGARRTFRLDRILAAEIGEVAEPPATGEDTEGLPVAPTTGERVRLVVAPGARWLIESADLLHSEAVEGGWTMAEFMVADTSWLVRTVLGLGGLVEIVSPADLRDRVRMDAERALSAAFGAP